MRYEGIKKGYPRIKNEKISAYIQLLRPFTLVPAFVAGIFGVLIQILYDGLQFSIGMIPVLFFVGFLLALGQAIGQVVNQICDIPIDKINKPYRPLASGKIDVREAIFLVCIFLVLYVWLVFLVNTTFAIIMLVLLFFAVFYSVKPIRTKNKLWINLMWISVSRGLLPILATWSVYGNIYTLFPWVVGIFATLWVFAFQSTKDIPDVIGDELFDVKTLPVVYGLEKTKKIMTVLSVFPFAWLTIALLTTLDFRLIVLYVLIAFAAGIIRTLDVIEEKLENTRAWVLFYLGLGSIYIFVFLALLFNYVISPW